MTPGKARSEARGGWVRRTRVRSRHDALNRNWNAESCTAPRFGSTALSLAATRLRNLFRCGTLFQRKLRTVLAVAQGDRTRSASAGARASAQVATQASPSRMLRSTRYIFMMPTR